MFLDLNVFFHPHLPIGEVVVVVLRSVQVLAIAISILSGTGLRWSNFVGEAVLIFIRGFERQ